MFINYESEIIMKIESDLQSSCFPFTPSVFFVFPLIVLTTPSSAVLLLALSSAKFSCWFADVAK